MVLLHNHQELGLNHAIALWQDGQAPIVAKAADGHDEQAGEHKTEAPVPV